MSTALGSLTAAWVAGGAAMVVLVLPVASVAMLLPAGACRTAALLWAGVGAVGIGVAGAVVVSSPAWASNPLAYTPHLERPLPHICFRSAAQGWLGGELVRAASIVVCALIAFGVARVVIGLVQTARLAGKAGDWRPIPNPFYPRAAASEDSGAVTCTVGLLRPRILLAMSRLRDLSPAAQAAVVLHEVAHARWRDPLVALVLRFVASCWPLPGQLLLSQWLQHSEAAADALAAQRAGAAAWLEAAAAMGKAVSVGGGSGQALGGPGTSGVGAVAAAGSWLLLAGAALASYGAAAWSSVICLFETVAAAWG